MITDNNIFDKDQARAEIYYDLYDPLLFEIREELEQVLSPSIPVESKRIMWGVAPNIPIFEIIFIFAGTQIATSILNKIAEDFYSLVKDKIRKTLNKDHKPIRLNIIVIVNEITTQGSLTFNDHETIADAMKAVEQMINDAHTKEPTEIDKISKGALITWRDKTGISSSQSKLQFLYQFDEANKKWELKSIHKLD
jgi:hypothetical protein